MTPAPQSASTSAGPLSDVLVVDLSRALAGPHATMMLADQGARVIKVEAPGRGDDTRGWGPPFVGEEGRRESTYFLSANRNKESITLDLKDAADKDVLLALVDRADVLVENFRTGVLERLGLGIESLMERNPRLVVLSITGFGHDGPEGGRAGYDQIAQGEAGLMSLTGSGPDDPQRVGVPIADLLSGMYGAYGVVAALNERHRTGRGTVVRTSLLASRRRRARLPGHALDGGRRGRPSAGQPPPVDRALRPLPLPRRARCRSPSAARGCGSGSARPSGSTRPPRGSRPTPSGSPHRDRVIEVVEAAFADWDAEPLLAASRRGRACPPARCARLDEVYAWDQTASQGLLVEVEHPTLGRLTLPGPPLRFFDGDGDRGDHRRDHAAPPTLDEDGARHPRLAAGRSDGASTVDRPRAARPRARRRVLRVVGRAHRHQRAARGLSPPARGRRGEGRHRRVGAHRARAVRGRPVAVVVNEFRFLAGSIGRAAAERITAAVRRATAEGLPVLASTASGGTRMQEGTPAFIAHGRDLAGAHGAPGRAAALPRAPAPPDHRRRVCVVGLARARDRGRARRARRLPRPQGLRGAQRPAVPAGRADGREPRRQGGARRRGRSRGPADARRPGARRPRRPPDRAAPRSPRG